MLVLECDRLLDLIIFRADPGVIFIAVGMKPGKGLKAFLVVPVVNKPTRRLFNRQKPQHFE